jgi:hypothetical protein
MITASVKMPILVVSICALFSGQIESQGIHEPLSAATLQGSKAKKPYVTPEMQAGKPQPGKRVKVIPDGYAGTNVYHSLYLPQGHATDKRYPVIVEYTGTYCIHGTVTRKDGMPMRGVLVETGMSGVDYKGIYTHFSITDTKGAYRIEGLTKGERLVMVKDSNGVKTLQSKKVDLQADEVLNFSVKEDMHHCLRIVHKDPNKPKDTS